jgi:ubiquinone/menaquinone biosynthesis C-methylase UbiE
MAAEEMRRHWDEVYSTKRAQETSWYQDEPRLSLEMIEKTNVGRMASIIDVGGGASTLVDHLLDRSYTDLTVLDISAAALQQSRQRLGERADRINWVECDITAYSPGKTFEVWHDRAMFHFLTSAEDRRHYLQVLRAALNPGGHAIICEFAPDGPSKCSGLDIVQYDALKMSRELGQDFVLQEQEKEKHRTPLGKEQRFGCYRFRRLG